MKLWVKSKPLSQCERIHITLWAMIDVTPPLQCIDLEPRLTTVVLTVVQRDRVSEYHLPSSSSWSESLPVSLDNFGMFFPLCLSLQTKGTNRVVSLTRSALKNPFYFICAQTAWHHTSAAWLFFFLNLTNSLLLLFFFWKWKDPGFLMLYL